MTRDVTIAAAAYPLDWFDDFAGFEAKAAHWVAEAAGQGAQLLVFPEYGAMELASLGGPAIAADLEGALSEVARHRPRVDALFARLAAEHGVHILGPSGPVFTGNRPVNRATLFGPGGVIGHQDKQIMTRFEREEWDVVPGADGLAVFDTELGRLGVVICYDSEFPLLGRALAEAGVEILGALVHRVAGGFHAGAGRIDGARAGKPVRRGPRAPGRERRVVRRSRGQHRPRVDLWAPGPRLAGRGDPGRGSDGRTRLGSGHRLARSGGPDAR